MPPPPRRGTDRPGRRNLRAARAAPPGLLAGVEVLDSPTYDQRTRIPALVCYVDIVDIVDFAGVSRQRACEPVTRPDFPPAGVHTSAGPLRGRRDVQAWLDYWNRKPGRPLTTGP